MDNEEKFEETGMFDEDYDDIVTLLSDDGKEVNFIDIARIEYQGNTYEIMQPEELPENLAEDEALLFLVTEDESGADRYDIVEDEDILDAVFDEYNRMYDEDMAEDGYED